MARKVAFVTLVLAHRGASARFAENTVEAFRGAVDLGADGVELDVRRTRDGELAVVHDALLADGRPVADVAWGELPHSVCDLASALDACDGLALVNVEIKNSPEEPDFDPDDAVARRVVDLLASRGHEPRSRWLVSCFHLPTVDLVRALDPRLATGWLVVDASDAAGVVASAAEHGHHAVHPHHVFVSAELVSRAHDAGLAVNTWTVDDPDRMRWLADVGVDAIITNLPDIARTALSR